MNKTTRVYIVRHGETEWNRAGRIQGHLDSPLTSRGIAQAETVAERLRGAKIDAIYSSDLQRAHRTAQLISNAIGCPITVEPRLRERALGIFEGLDEAEIEERYPEDWKRFLSRDPDYCIPDGESARARAERSAAVLRDVGERHATGTVLLVTHGGILDAVFRIVVGLPLEAPRHFKIWNAGINLVSRPAREAAVGGTAVGYSQTGAQRGANAAAGNLRRPGSSENDTGALSSGGPAGSAGDGWMIELWGDTGTLLDGHVLDDT